VDACLAREGGIAVAPTDRTLARRIGHLLVAAGRRSADHVYAAVVAVCAAAGGGVVLTGDTTDLALLSGRRRGHHRPPYQIDADDRSSKSRSIGVAGAASPRQARHQDAKMLQ
jgi:hypothetical protein